MYDCQVSLPSPPPHHLFPLFLPSFLPSVFNPAQFARLDETILVISACNGTLLTPITTIKTLLPLGPFQVLINQMAAKRPFGPPPPRLTHVHTRALALTHTFSPALTDHVASLKSTSGGTKRLNAGRQMPPLYKWKASLSLPLSFTLSLSLPVSLSLSPSLWCGYNEHYKPPWHSALLGGFGKLPSLFLANCLIDALFLLMIRICPPPLFLFLPTAAHGYRYKRNYTLLASHAPFQQTVLET